MKYVALLRGINVGGKNRVAMAKLKITFEKAGMGDVKTYINSGNVIFSCAQQSEKALANQLEASIEKDFDLQIKVLVCSQQTIEAIMHALPASWQNNQEMKCDIMFLWERHHTPNIINELAVRPGIDDVKYVKGALIWRVDRKNVTKSGLLKIIGTPLYKQMTVRNCNTLRKLAAMVAQG
jgi:uncharacterized protein (DUF1697 family)